MPKTINGLHCGRLINFAPIFRQWIKANTEMAHAWKSANDVPWWYNERAFLSIFAGAIWRADGLVFEEYSDRKRRIKKTTGTLGREYAGRGDLYFRWRRWDFVAEAKFTWSGFSRNKYPLARIGTELKRACRDVRQARRKWSRKLGILFVTPYFRKECMDDVDDRIHEWIKRLGDLDATAYAYVFPDCSRHFQGEDKLYYPGTAVIIRERYK
jgi:hypothetical protein